MTKEPLSVMVDFHKESTDNFISLVNEYEDLGERIISEGYVLQKGKVDATKIMAEHKDYGIQQHNKPLQKFINSVNQDLDGHHERFLSACNQFTGVNEMRLHQARELEVADYTNAQMRDRFGESSKGGMQRDSRLKTIMEYNMSEEPHTNEREENEPVHKKRHWNTKWLHPAKFLLNFIKKRKPE